MESQSPNISVNTDRCKRRFAAACNGRLLQPLGVMTNALLTTYRYPFFCLVGAFAAGVAFYGLSVWRGDGAWFARGGAVVCLLALAAEYGLIQVQQQALNNRISGVGGWGGPVLKDLDIAPPFPRLKVAAHILVINGTFIWGFGDLLA